MDALLLHRLHFAFTITYHYFFPQLTMGLALLIVVLKTVALRPPQRERYNEAARFWAKIFAINFLIGVVTGIPMEFQFGTNWAQFSRATGGVIGQPLAMEGVFSFFLESAFLGLFLFGEKRLSPWTHWGSAFLVFLGSWISGFFIIVTNAWMQHPVAYSILPNGSFESHQFLGAAAEPLGAAAVRAQHVRRRHHRRVCDVRGRSVLPAGRRFAEHGRIFVRVGVIAGVIACVTQIFPTGDLHGRYLANHQPAAMAAMEGLFSSQAGAPIVLMGQPDEANAEDRQPHRRQRPAELFDLRDDPGGSDGLDQFPRDQWPSPLPLLFYSYHIMAGLGTYFVALMLLEVFLLWRGRLFTPAGPCGRCS